MGIRSALLSVSLWPLLFAVWMLWESAVRILFHHPWWDLRSSLVFSGANLLLGLVIGLTFAIIQLLLILALKRFRRLRMLSATRLWYVAVAALILPVVVIVSVQAVRNRSTGKHPGSDVHSIVLISIDTLRHDYVGAYGAGNVRTPTIDGVANEGALFEVAVAPVPETGPSHTSMLTGQSPLGHGIRLNGQVLGKTKNLLALQLRKAGFNTAAFISGFPLKARNSGLDQGFQTYSDDLSIKDYFNQTFIGRWVEKIPVFGAGIYRQAPEVTDVALRWLSRNGDAPFFLFLHYFDPHYPYGMKAKLQNARHPLYIRASPDDLPLQKKLYAQEVELVDSQIRRIIEKLKEHEIYDRTLLILVSDHGESLGEHNYYYDHGRYVYEQLVRVPFIVRDPSRIQGPRVFAHPVSVIDVYKTILEAVGVPPAPGTEGYDLISLGASPADYNRSILSHHFANHVNSIRNERWKLIETKKRKRTAYELYDLQNDPGEMQNVFDQNREVANALLLQLQRTMKQYGQEGDLSWSPDQLSEEDREALRSLGYLDE